MHLLISFAKSHFRAPNQKIYEKLHQIELRCAIVMKRNINIVGDAREV